MNPLYGGSDFWYWFCATYSNLVHQYKVRLSIRLLIVSDQHGCCNVICAMVSKVLFMYVTVTAIVGLMFIELRVLNRRQYSATDSHLLWDKCNLLFYILIGFLVFLLFLLQLHSPFSFSCHFLHRIIQTKQKNLMCQFFLNLQCF